MEKKYIDADLLFRAMEDAAWYDNADRDDVAEELLLNFPAAGVVPVVRCKDCKHFDETGEDDLPPYCALYDIRRGLGDFCSDGQRCE